ncbi:MAG: response regulator [Chloroflexi bacterium]|nr:response regulator [Chloroflexota bacterium]
MLKVLVVDDSAAVRTQVSELLSLESDLAVIGQAKDGWEAIARVKSLRPDVVLMDVNLPSLNGIDATRRIKAFYPKSRVIFLAAETIWREQGLAAGGETFITKDEPWDAVLAALRTPSLEPVVPPVKKEATLAAPRGQRWIAPSWASRVLAGLGVLTPGSMYRLLWVWVRRRMDLDLLAKVAWLIAIYLVLFALLVFPALRDLVKSLTLGRVMAIISLIFGLLFFIYAVRYYTIVALILAFSGESGVANGNGRNGNGLHNGVTNGLHNGFRNGWTNGGLRGLVRRLALRLLGRGLGNGQNGMQNGNGGYNGLRNGKNGLHNGLHNGKNGYLEIPPIHLDPAPFVSIHLPLYNEQRVMDRLLEACTSLDYPNYEVIVADDSADQTLEGLERWAHHPRVKISHRINRKGFKGQALRYAMEVMDRRTEFVVIFDADFIPPAQIIWQFLAYFFGENGNGNGRPHKARKSRYLDDNTAAVQGYQWHILNGDENWITKGVRTEYSGSYVVERSAQEFLGTMKMISGSVYMIRADVLRKLGWGYSITEDWELTLKLYLDGYKVLYTPFIQAPSECVSTFSRLVRQRMRWAEGHTYNVKKFFPLVMASPNLSLRERLEFIYYAPYYLQSLFFMVGTAFWFISELILRQGVPYWTSLLGWSLVFTNMGALTLMNLAGLFMERGVKREWTGALSALILGMLLVPFQGYAALRGLLEAKEGGWFRTPKTGTITEIFDRLDLGGKLSWLLPRRLRRKAPRRAATHFSRIPGLSWLLRSPSRLANALISGMATLLLLLGLFSPMVPVVLAAPDTFYLRTAALNDGKEMTRGTAGSSATTLTINATGVYKWYSSETYPTGNDDASIASGAYDFILDYNRAAANSTITFTAQVGLSDPDGSNYSQFGESTSQTTANSGGNLTLSVTICGSCSAQTITAASPKKLVLRLNVTAVAGSGINLRYEGGAGSTSDSRLDTPTVVVPENGWVLLPLAAILPTLVSRVQQWRRHSEG